MSSPVKGKGKDEGNFSSKVRHECWEKADKVIGRNPDRWRKDAIGNTVGRNFNNCQGCLCYDYDHIVPYSQGGKSVVENCQILQTVVKIQKSDKTNVDAAELRDYSYDIKYDDKTLDTIEASVYGDVDRH